MTPLTGGGELLDEDAFDPLVGFLESGGLDGLLALGTTGEGILLSAAPEATRTAKRLIRERPDGERAARLAAKLRTSPEGQEGLRAFLDKRSAAWRENG